MRKDSVLVQTSQQAPGGFGRGRRLYTPRTFCGLA